MGRQSGSKSRSRSRDGDKKQSKKHKSHKEQQSSKSRSNQHMGGGSRFSNAPPDSSSWNAPPPPPPPRSQHPLTMMQQQRPPEMSSATFTHYQPHVGSSNIESSSHLRQEVSSAKALIEMKNRHLGMQQDMQQHDPFQYGGGNNLKNNNELKKQHEVFDNLINIVKGGNSGNVGGGIGNDSSSLNMNKYILMGAGLDGGNGGDKHQSYRNYDDNDDDGIIQINAVPVQQPSTTISNPLTDMTQVRSKITVPTHTNFNYTGLIIGPKGSNQKRLQELTRCKILVRGKGSQQEGQPPQPDDHEDQHVLIVGDNEIQVAQAVAEIQRIIFCDQDTRNKIRQEQLKLVAQMKNDNNQVARTETGDLDASLTTPYGPPNENAYIISVPKDCVGLVIGKGGQTIRMLQERTGARRVQVALENTPGTDHRNVFVEGQPDSVEQVKRMLYDIVENQKKMKQNQTKTTKIEVQIPLNMVGLVIGQNGDMVRSINQKTEAYVALSKEPEHMNLPDKKIMIITGSEQSCAEAKQEIEAIVEGGIQHQQHQIMLSQGLMPPGGPGGFTGMPPLHPHMMPHGQMGGMFPPNMHHNQFLQQQQQQHHQQQQQQQQSHHSNQQQQQQQPNGYSGENNNNSGMHQLPPPQMNQMQPPPFMQMQPGMLPPPNMYGMGMGMGFGGMGMGMGMGGFNGQQFEQASIEEVVQDDGGENQAKNNKKRGRR